jgi:hypothetical protein
MSKKISHTIVAIGLSVAIPLPGYATSVWKVLGEVAEHTATKNVAWAADKALMKSISKDFTEKCLAEQTLHKVNTATAEEVCKTKTNAYRACLNESATPETSQEQVQAICESTDLSKYESSTFGLIAGGVILCIAAWLIHTFFKYLMAALAWPFVRTYRWIASKLDTH